MGTSLYYRQVKPLEKVDFASGSYLWEKLEKAFNIYNPDEFNFSEEDIPVLRGLAAFDKSYETLIDAIHQYGYIAVGREC